MTSSPLHAWSGTHEDPNFIFPAQQSSFPLHIWKGTQKEPALFLQTEERFPSPSSSAWRREEILRQAEAACNLPCRVRH